MPMLARLPHGVFAPSFYDPMAGDGRLVQWLRESGRIAHGADLYPQANDHYPCLGVDYLNDTTEREFVITNPAFSIAFEACQHARKHAAEFMFLLRLAFLESDERGDWLSANEPNGLWVLKKRPSFVMSITCKSELVKGERNEPCRNNWMLPIDFPRPKACPKCGGTKLSISTSDNSGYAWFYFGDRQSLHGIHHI